LTLDVESKQNLVGLDVEPKQNPIGGPLNIAPKQNRTKENKRKIKNKKFQEFVCGYNHTNTCTMNTHTTYELQILQKKKETTTTHRK
jgi:hypothetical protein